MTTASKKWQVGDTYYEPGATLSGHEWDLGDCNGCFETEAEARESAEIWRDHLTKGEQQRATIYVVRLRVVAVDEHGQPSSGISF